MRDKPIVVGVDGSSSALHAVRWAAREAQHRGLPLRLVHAYEIPVATRYTWSTRTWFGEVSTTGVGNGCGTPGTR